MKNFLKFQGKNMYWRLFFNKVARGFNPGTLLKRFQYRCVPWLAASDFYAVLLVASLVG